MNVFIYLLIIGILRTTIVLAIFVSPKNTSSLSMLILFGSAPNSELFESAAGRSEGDGRRPRTMGSPEVPFKFLLTFNASRPQAKKKQKKTQRSKLVSLPVSDRLRSRIILNSVSKIRIFNTELRSLKSS